MTDWSEVQSPLDRQKQAFDDLVADTARLLNEHPRVRWTRDFCEAVRRADRVVAMESNR